MQPSPELREIITGWFTSVASGDSSWADRHISRSAGVRLIGTDPSEWLAGAEVAAFLKEEVRAMAGVVQVAPGETEAFVEGTVGWGVARPTLTMPGGMEVHPRWGAVFHREEGEWKLVQLHASVGVSNAELFGMEVTG